MRPRPTYFAHRPQCQAPIMWPYPGRRDDWQCRLPAFYQEVHFSRDARDTPLICGVHRARRIRLGYSVASHFSKLSPEWLLARAVQLVRGGVTA